MKILRLTLTLNESNLVGGFNHFKKMNRQFVYKMHSVSLKSYYTKSGRNVEDAGKPKKLECRFVA
jgi:hypothetical protein